MVSLSPLTFRLLPMLFLLASCLGKEPQAASSLALTAPAGKLLHGVFVGGGEEEDPTPARLERYENAVGKKAAWVYFSNNWFTSRAYPQASSEAIRKSGSVPFIRLMLRSSTDIDVSEPKFTLEKINAGEFDSDLKAWGDAAKTFKTPLIVEFGTEVNGKWFSWNGFWHGANTDGPKKFREAYRRIIQTIRARGATNITWVFHVAGDDDPSESWNKLENYYPGSDVIDWLGISAYGAQEPTSSDVEGFGPTTRPNHAAPRETCTGETDYAARVRIGHKSPECERRNLDSGRLGRDARQPLACPARVCLVEFTLVQRQRSKSRLKNAH